jgi:hypothetical protein
MRRHGDARRVERGLARREVALDARPDAQPADHARKLRRHMLKHAVSAYIFSCGTVCLQFGRTCVRFSLISFTRSIGCISLTFVMQGSGIQIAQMMWHLRVPSPISNLYIYKTLHKPVLQVPVL